MAIQQLADINLGGSRSVGGDQKNKSTALSADKSPEATPFKDQVKKQLDQARADAKSDSKIKKDDNNQQLEDREALDAIDDSTLNADAKVVEKVVETGETDAAVDISSSETQDSDLSNLSNLSIEKELNAFTAMLNVVLLSEESMGSKVIVDASALPGVGKQLPPVVTTPLSSQQTLDQLKALTSTPQTVINANKAGADVDVPVIEMAALKPMPVIGKTDFLSSQNTGVSSEATSVEIIANATRLQQVPLATSISNSLSVGQNIPLSASETALPLTSAAPLNNSLSTIIGVHLQSPDWSRQMSDQVSLMVKGGFQQAEIKLNPAHLGPMEIKLSVQDDKASVNFVTHHAPVRDAIDSAMPRLREMLEQQGLSLDVNVSTQSEQQQANEDLQNAGNAMADSDNSEQAVDAMSQDVVMPLTVELDSGINLYA